MLNIKACIVGAAGYTGGQMARLLLNHPECKDLVFYSQSQAGKLLSQVHEDMLPYENLKFTGELELADCYFLCLGHGESEKFVHKYQDTLASKLIIDLSQDFRATENPEGFIYGLPEFNRSLITETQRLANPGCFATAITLGLLPMAHLGLLNDDIHITAITGSTGAGQKPQKTSHFSWRNENISIYKLFQHQHLSEIRQSLEKVSSESIGQINFIPMRGNFSRGILASIHLKTDESLDKLLENYQSFYEKAPFVRVSQETLNLKQVLGSNFCFLSLTKQGGYLHITSIIDNLIKGACGQAIQNLNLMLGIDEKTGLKLTPFGL